MTRPKYTRPPAENDEYAGMVERILAAWIRRIAAGDTDDLARFREVIDRAEASLREAVAGQRATGTTWAQIGASLGISRQWAWERFGDGRPSGAPDPARAAGMDVIRRH